MELLLALITLLQNINEYINESVWYIEFSTIFIIMWLKKKTFQGARYRNKEKYVIFDIKVLQQALARRQATTSDYFVCPSFRYKNKITRDIYYGHFFLSISIVIIQVKK